MVDSEEGLTPVEIEIVAFDHVYIGDISAYVLRSNMPRVVYKEESVPARSDQAIPVGRGYILI
ncbi:DUF871 domain-containing protein, partial [Streptococcus suis]|uniref:phospho-sugar glycosidase domain-containing protein n=1 Tax=Streptococcus suis TaxID=1307 RepID=UPI00207C145B